MQSRASTRSDDRDSPTISVAGITFDDLTRLLAGRGITARNLSDEAEDDDDDDYQDEYTDSSPQVIHKWFPEVTEPQEAGLELLKSGDFGRVGDKLRSRRSDINIAKFIYKRPMQLKPVPSKEDYASVCIYDAQSHGADSS